MAKWETSEIDSLENLVEECLNSGTTIDKIDWNNVAENLNFVYRNSRSSDDCRKKYDQLTKNRSGKKKK